MRCALVSDYRVGGGGIGEDLAEAGRVIYSAFWWSFRVARDPWGFRGGPT